MEETKLRVWAALVALAVMLAVLFVIADRAGAEETPVLYENIGVVGCSNTLQAVQGYNELTLEYRLLETAKATKDMRKWAKDPVSTDRRGSWEKYVTMRPVEGYDAAWVELCGRWQNRKNKPNFGVSTIQTIVNKIHSLDPGIPVFVSPLPRFPDESCRSTGGNKLVIATEAMLFDIFATVDDTFPGPVFDPLLPGMTDEGGCHMTEAGKLAVGQQLVEFFDE